MSDAKLFHPADDLAKALLRATGLLQTMGDLYNAENETFSGGNAFTIHAISTVQTLVSDARAALEDLHFNCDLTLLNHPGMPTGPIVLPEATPMETAPEGKTVPDVPQPDLAAAPEVHEPPAQVAIMQPGPAPDQEPERFAQTYLELLRKLTAAEVFAAEQQALSLPGTSPDLLPLLRSLREDLQKMTNAA